MNEDNPRDEQLKGVLKRAGFLGREHTGDVPRAVLREWSRRTREKGPVVERAFSEKEREFLGEKGGVIIPLDSSLLGDQIVSGKVSLWRHQEKPLHGLSGAVRKDRSLYSEVAVIPDSRNGTVFLQGSRGHSQSEQEEMIAEYYDRLRGESGPKDMRAIMGSVADYAQVFMRLYDFGNRDLVVPSGGYIARTTTKDGSDNVNVGYLDAFRFSGLVINRDPDASNNPVYAAPLIVPA